MRLTTRMRPAVHRKMPSRGRILSGKFAGAECTDFVQKRAISARFQYVAKGDHIRSPSNSFSRLRE